MDFECLIISSHFSLLVPDRNVHLGQLHEEGTFDRRALARMFLDINPFNVVPLCNLFAFVCALTAFTFVDLACFALKSAVNRTLLSIRVLLLLNLGP